MNQRFQNEGEQTPRYDSEGSWLKFSKDTRNHADFSRRSVTLEKRNRLIQWIPIIGITLVGFFVGRWTVHSPDLPATKKLVYEDLSQAQKENVLKKVGNEYLGLQYDPYYEGYTRSLSVYRPSTGQSESYLVDSSVVPAPPGFNVRLIRPDAANKVISGGPGTVTLANREKLANCIRSLIRLEEESGFVGNNLTTVSYDRAPWQDVNAGYWGRPVFPGWHDIEVETSAGKLRFLLPDHRYAQGKEAEYRKALNERLYYQIDQKVFSEMGPYGSESNSMDWSHDFQMLPGVSMIVHGKNRSFFAKGAKLVPQALPKNLGPLLLQFRASMAGLLDRVTKQPEYATLSTEQARKLVFSVRVVYSMGERQYWMSLADLRMAKANPVPVDLDTRLKEFVYWAGFTVSSFREGSTPVVKYQQQGEQYSRLPIQEDQATLAAYR